MPPALPPIVVRLDPGVREIAVVGQTMRITMRSWTEARDVPFAFAAAAPVLEWLAAPGIALDELHRRAVSAGGWSAVAEVLASLGRRRLLGWTYGPPEAPLLVVEPLGGRFAPDYDAPPPRARRLSRFAYVHLVGERPVLECPEVEARISITERGHGLLPALLAAGDGGSGLDHFLACVGFLEPAGPEAQDRQTWEFHDRLFHEETRYNVSGRVQGGTYRFRERFPSPPALKPPMSATRIPLPAADDANTSASLLSIMETRVSKRGPGRRALQRDELAHLLWRVARVRTVLKDEAQDLFSRPYPSGGSINELEFYLAIHRCDGLAPGLYHYVGAEHALAPLAAPPAAVLPMLDLAAQAQLATGARPDCLIVISARLPRLAWKYQGIAYRIALMNAGVAIDALYLVATDLGLSPCAVGTGNSTLFAQATGLSPWEETAIAEFTVNGPQ